MALGVDDLILLGSAMAFLGGGIGMGNMFTSARTSYKYNKRLQDDAQRHQINMFKHQHQWSVDDLRSAGLNPILSTHSASSMPSASSNSVGVSPVQPLDLMGSVVKAQGFSSARDMQKFARENHEVDLATKEADLAIRELTADNIRADIALKTANSALYMLDVDRRSRDWYKRFEDLRDLRNTYKGSTSFGHLVDDFEGQIMRFFMNLNETQSNSAFRISKPASQSRFTNYKYKYHKN